MDDEEAEAIEMAELRAMMRPHTRLTLIDEGNPTPPLYFPDPLLDKLREIHVEPRYDFFKGYKPRK